MKSRLYLLICICWVVIGNLNAQYSRLFTIETGLSSSLINNLYQDKYGDIWICTEYGLNRYDGAKFINYKSIQNDSTSLLSNNVYSVYESDDKLYILSTGGLQIYDYSTDKFHTLLRSMKNYNNKCMLKRGDGTVLSGTSGFGIKILDLDIDGETIVKTLNNKYNGYNINNLLEDNSGNLWISTEFNGLIRLDSSGNEQRYNTVGSDSISSVGICVMDSGGRVYISSIGNGVYECSRNGGSLKKIYDTRYPVTSIVQRGGRMLIGTDGDGIAYYDIMTGNTGKVESFISDINLSEAKVHSILVDNYDNLWVGVYQKGVVFIPAKTNKFGYIGSHSTLNNSIGDKCVTAICSDHLGQLIVGTDNDGMYMLDENFKMKYHLSPRTSNNYAPNSVMCLFRDSYDRIWVGSYLDGLSVFDTKNLTFTKVYFFDNTSINANRVYSLCEDKDGRLWIGTMGAGLYYVEIDNPYIVYDVYNVGDSKIDLNNNVNLWINALYYSPSGILYIGTVDGIKCLDLNTASYIISSDLRGKTVKSISQDHMGNIWVGTIDGVKVFNTDLSVMLDSYSVNDGLPSDNIASIIPDSSGNMWISTNLGIAKFDYHTEKFISFNASDGFYNNEFSRGTCYSDVDGNIYWGGTNGIVYFRPDEVKVEQTKYKTRITGLYIHGKPVSPNSMSGGYCIADSPVRNGSSVNLSHLDNSFAIEFAPDNFSVARDFEYSMNGGAWNSLTQGTSSVSFSNLQPGDYKFAVRGKDMGDEFMPATLFITIHPAWYATVWAKIVYSIIILSVLFLILYQARLRYLVRQEMLEHKLREESNEARLQFFINIAHEIRTPMSLIISPLHKLISSDRDPIRQKDYSLMDRNADRILTLVNQLMDTRKIDKGQMKLRFAETDLVGYVKDIIEIFTYQADAKGIKLDVVSTSDSINVWIDPNHFDKVILNLLSNSFKHVSNEGEITVRLSVGEDNDCSSPLCHYAEIIVQDNGTGIKEDEIEHIFERFYQISTDASTQCGTGIGLHLAMSLVKLHYGTMSVRNNTPNPGCSFYVRIPLGNAHLNTSDMIDVNSFYQHKPYSMPLPVENVDETVSVSSKSVRKRYTVLLADDDDETRNYLASELGKTYHIQQARNGKEALDIVSSNIPDLVIVDVMMPLMDGISFLKKIRQNIKTNHIPVVLLTALNSESDNIEGISSGADAYITKPFSISIVATTVANLLRSREVLKNNFGGGQEQLALMDYINPESADEKLMKKVMKVINDNIGNPELNVEMIAAHVGISRVHLYRKLKELTNQSTRDFIRNTRLKQAEALLIGEKDYNISEIALLVGFCNATYFSNAFKELYGVSPSKYAELHKIKNSDIDKDNEASNADS